jgi:hypothetical protein
MNMKKYSLDSFVNNNDADVSTGVIAKVGQSVILTIKKKERWGADSKGRTFIPVGGIGGKTEQGESPWECLKRECIEEVGVSFNVSRDIDHSWFLTDNTITPVELESNNDEPIPWVIYQKRRTEEGRKPHTNIFIYKGNFLGIPNPIDDPAIIEIPVSALEEMNRNSFGLRKLINLGGSINSKIEIPLSGFLFPVGTAVAICRLVDNKILI